MASLIRVSADCELSVKEETSMINEITIPKIVARSIRLDTSWDSDSSSLVCLVDLKVRSDSFIVVPVLVVLSSAISASVELT